MWLPSRRKEEALSWTSCILLAFGLNIWLVEADKSQADYFIHSLPGQPPGPLLKMHAGHIEVNPEHNGNLFFWHFQNRHIANRQRTVLWLNGGPGCSSMDGALMELGPYRVKESGELEYNDGSWDEFANVLFVDNPVGTGFSYVNTDSYLHELPEMADQMIIFLEKWFALFPEYEHDDLYIAGESYAGQHIPYIARAILEHNAQASASGGHIWNMKGLLIGNGWISPVEQYASYLPFSYEENLIQGGTAAAANVEKQHAVCMAELSKPSASDKVSIGVCEDILQSILSASRAPGDRCLNMYDIRLDDTYPSCGMSWPPDLSQVTPYLRRQDVISALHINPDKRTGWIECSGSVSSNFRAKNSKPSIQLIPGLLEAGLPILLFSGAKDLICNHLGTEQLINNMEWSGGKGFELSPGVWAPKRDWSFENEPAGIYQEARNLTYVLFYNSSHMVPFDYARRTRDMLDRFMAVDIASIGGKPADSRVDGEKAGPETSVGGHPNSTLAVAEEKQKLRDAELAAYYRSGETAFIIILIAALAWGWWVWYARRSERRRGYMGVPLGGRGRDSPLPTVFRDKRHHHHHGDVEAADFDENELDDLRSSSRHHDGRQVSSHADDHLPGMEAEHYGLGSDSESDGEEGNVNRKKAGA